MRRRRHPTRTLTFAERVAYQQAIEEVYWRHRIWPKEHPDPKPSLDAVMSHAKLEKKVTDYLRNSQSVGELLAAANDCQGLTRRNGSHGPAHQTTRGVARTL